MSQGWIKLHRKIREWGWYTEPDTLRVFIHLLLSANHDTTFWRGERIGPGELLTGRHQLARELHMGEQRIRTALTRLKSTSEVTIKTTNRFSLIKLNNWKLYQEPTSKLTNNQPTTNQQLTTSKKAKNENNEKKPRINKEEEIKIFRGAETMKEILKRKYPQFPIKD